MAKWRRLIFLLSTLFLGAGFAFPATAQTADGLMPQAERDGERIAQFARVIEDLPLMPGLTLQDNEDLLFVEGTRRIAQTTATGYVSRSQVETFYRQSLPQLGWRRVDSTTYRRESERLRIDIDEHASLVSTMVRFSVEPLE